MEAFACKEGTASFLSCPLYLWGEKPPTPLPISGQVSPPHLHVTTPHPCFRLCPPTVLPSHAPRASGEKAAPRNCSMKDRGPMCSAELQVLVSTPQLPPPRPLGGFLFPCFLHSHSPQSVCMPSTLPRLQTSSGIGLTLTLQCPPAAPSRVTLHLSRFAPRTDHYSPGFMQAQRCNFL